MYFILCFTKSEIEVSVGQRDIPMFLHSAPKSILSTTIKNTFLPNSSIVVTLTGSRLILLFITKAF